MRKVVVAGLLLAAISVSCGSGTGGATGAAADDHHHHGSDKGSVPGAPADPSQADRKITVVASDDLRFDPSTIEVSAGEVVTFVVRNEGQTKHEFVLGDEAYQEAHARDMAAHGHHMSSDSAVTVGPGETAKLTWRFDEAGEVLYGCHEPGHYDGGMIGTIEVS